MPPKPTETLTSQQYTVMAQSVLLGLALALHVSGKTQQDLRSLKAPALLQSLRDLFSEALNNYAALRQGVADIRRLGPHTYAQRKLRELSKL